MKKILAFLEEIVSLLRGAQRQREVMDHKEAADYLRVSTKYLYSIRETYGIPFFMVGTEFRYRKVALDHWMETREVNTPEEHRRLLDGRRTAA